MASSIISKPSLPVEKVNGLTASNTYASATCNYVKCGNVVTASFTVTALADITQSTGTLQFTELPSTSVQTTGIMRTLISSGSERGTYNGVAALSGKTLVCLGPKTKDTDYAVSITYVTD